MRYGGRLNRLEFTALIDQQANRIRASATALPLYGPTGWTGPCRIGAWSWEDDRLMHAGLQFGETVAGGAWIEVITTAGPPMPLLIDVRMAANATGAPADRRAAERMLRAASSPAPERVGIAVDGAPKPFHRWPDHSLGPSLGTGWLATLDEVPGLLLRVSGLTPAEISLARVGDPEPHLVGTRAHLLAGYDAYGAD
ncbi:hypothetical protein GCM10010399_37600 [Dactylosporangium fulvum]|uniref:Uncharacterized protein n=1 Tax=Dactylosporangium fulvum TaxID=53359 RepID=A0ABY5VT96_9ACTN|nr:hypothetical protein [Dactylosporangium fulvum]UWP80977.1 hypothetical protein Dfulv_38520 [Dactylosporangium fulvum]